MQQSLPLPEETTDIEITTTCKTTKDAFRLSLLKSGKSAEVVALQLQERGHTIDKSTLSLALSNNPPQKKNFPLEAIDDFIDLTTDIPIRYAALRKGCGLVRLKSTVELENEKLRAENEELKQFQTKLQAFFKGSDMSMFR